MAKYIVRYGAMRNLGAMSVRGDSSFRRGMEVIVRSDRGLEVGQVLCEAQEDALSHLDKPASGQIVREVSKDDVNEIQHIDASREEKLAICEREIDKLGLQMKLVDLEQLFGGERLVVYYLAEDRVDFRELVKKLASEFQTRIEMRQIGVRDEAKLLADYGDCGKPVCCNTHLVTMPPVSMRMAKLQKATLDPTKISGRCGRLKCCLRYEFDTYEEIQKQLPRVGSTVVTRNGKARVLNQQIIAEQLLIEMEDHRRVVIDASEVLSIIKKSNSSDKKEDASHKEKETDKGSQVTTSGKKSTRKSEKDSNKESRGRNAGDSENSGKPRRKKKGRKR